MSSTRERGERVFLEDLVAAKIHDVSEGAALSLGAVAALAEVPELLLRSGVLTLAELGRTAAALGIPPVQLLPDPAAVS